MKIFCLVVFILIILAYVFSISKQTEKFRNCNMKPDISIDKYILKSEISPSSIETRLSEDKYILKTDISPSIETSSSEDKYILKTNIPPSIEHIDRDKYILKSEIPTCPRVDLSKYVLKSSLNSNQNSHQNSNQDYNKTSASQFHTNKPNLDFGLDAYDSTDNMATLDEQDNNLHKYIKNCNTNEWNMNNNYGY